MKTVAMGMALTNMVLRPYLTRFWGGGGQNIKTWAEKSGKGKG